MSLDLNKKNKLVQAAKLNTAGLSDVVTDMEQDSEDIVYTNTKSNIPVLKKNKFRSFFSKLKTTSTQHNMGKDNSYRGK